MKVYVVEWFTYESESGIHKIFSSKEAAYEYIKKMGKGPHGGEGWDEQYFLSGSAEEIEVE